MKTGKEIKIDKFKNYKIVYGSVNNKHPKAVYINLSAWADPIQDEDINYGKVIRSINKKIKQTLYQSFSSDVQNGFMEERSIIDLDIRESGIRYGKRSFTSCEITLFLDIETPVTSELMKNKLNIITTLIIDNVFDNSEYFKFTRKKK